MTAQKTPFWTLLNQPFTLWVLSVLVVAIGLIQWRAWDLQLQSKVRAVEEHERLHIEVKSRLLTLQDAIRDKVSTPEVRRSLDSGSSATVSTQMETRSLRSLAFEHDELSRRGKVYCPLSLEKGIQPIYDSLRSDSLNGARTGVGALLAQIGGGGS